jgi:hypothetical protein
MAPTNWIDLVLTETEHVETPRSWLYWSLLCAVSAAMGNNYFLVALKGAVVVKANLYTILLGESGLGKEFPVNLAKELVDRATVTRVIAGRSSIQAIVKELSLTKTREKKEPLGDSRGFVVNGELSTAIIQDPDSLTILTDLYDNKSSWTNLLKGDGAEKLKHPYITCLFGSSPAHFYDSIPKVNMEGGYIGRNLIIFEEKRYKDTDLFGNDDDSNLTSFPYEKFIGQLEAINSHSGRIVPSNDARELFNAWRAKWRREQLPDISGFINRVPVHVLKVAMCLCVANQESSKTLIITPEQMEEAIFKTSQLVYANKKATDGKGIDPLAAQTKMVLDFLVSAPGHMLRQKQLLNKGYGNYDTSVLTKIIDNLIEIGWVTRERFIAGSATDWEYTLAGEPLEQYTKFLEARKK